MPSVLVNAILATSCALFVALPSLAQAQAENVSNDTVAGPGSTANGGFTGPTGSASLFSIPNYEGDNRQLEMYGYLHDPPYYQWNSYYNLVKQIADQSLGAVPVPHFPEMGSNAGYENAVLLGAGGGGGGQNANGGMGTNGNYTSGGPVATAPGAITNSGQAVTSVSGSVTNPQTGTVQSVPGLVGE